jgi:transketolase
VTHPDRSSLSNVDERIARLERLSAETRVSIVHTINGPRMGHIGGDLSVTDILVTLFFGVMRYKAAEPGWKDRDRFVLSKGHCSAALYSVLAKAGYFEPALLASFMAPLSPLNGHPNRRKVKGVEANTGPLGHGLPFAVGTAVAARISGADYRSFVVLGDGELQEGSNWEAAMFAGHRGLDNLTAFVDRNRLQQGARTEDTNGLDPLPEKWTAFGWDAHLVDGHDHAALLAAIEAPRQGRPRVLVCNTIKGKGVSFIEDRVEWHHKVPSPEQTVLALEELAVR